MDDGKCAANAGPAACVPYYFGVYFFRAACGQLSGLFESTLWVNVCGMQDMIIRNKQKINKCQVLVS